MSGVSKPSITRARAGFTLIELLVVIGIILLLVALTITVGTGVLRQSEVRETQNTLRLLDVAVQEWEIGVDRQVLYGIEDEPCDGSIYELQQSRGAGFSWTGANAEGQAFQDALETTDQLWEVFGNVASVRDVIANVNPAFLRELDPEDPNAADLDHLTSRSYRFLDSWDRPILAVLPGRAYSRRAGAGCTVDSAYDVSPARQADDDGTIRTPYEVRFGVAADRRIFFVSAGPSGVFGGLHLNTDRGSLNATQRDDVADAGDNVYSYPVLTEFARP